jgi:alpha-tubulin suppressor-like RCC1 family protein
MLSMNTPVSVGNLNNAIAVAAGADHSMALLNDGTIQSWGANGAGQLGDGSILGNPNALKGRLTPGPVIGIDNVAAITIGLYHSGALDQNGAVWTWGDNRMWQLGNGDNDDGSTIPSDSSVPLKIAEEKFGNNQIISVSAGYFFTLAADSQGNVWAWGDNEFGQLGLDTATTSSKEPIKVEQIGDIKAVAAGAYHSVALDNDGYVWTWGDNLYGQLGGGTFTENPRYTPKKIRSLYNIIAIAAKGSFTVALDRNGVVWTWGNNENGELGDNSLANRSTPQQVTPFFKKFVVIAAGFNHAAALRNDGTIWTWGYNGYGQLGIGNYNNRYSPTEVSDPETVLE